METENLNVENVTVEEPVTEEVTEPTTDEAADEKAEPFSPAQQKLIDAMINRTFAKAMAKAETAAAEKEAAAAAALAEKEAEASKTLEERMADAASKNSELEAKVKELTVSSLALEHAVKAGFKPEKISAALILAKVSEVELGDNTAEQVAARIEAVKQDNPEWLSVVGKAQGAVDHSSTPPPAKPLSLGESVRAQMGL